MLSFGTLTLAILRGGAWACVGASFAMTGCIWARPTSLYFLVKLREVWISNNGGSHGEQDEMGRRIQHLRCALQVRGRGFIGRRRVAAARHPQPAADFPHDGGREKRRPPQPCGAASSAGALGSDAGRAYLRRQRHG